jgi:2-oxoglutarate dehydrogenase E2 component (dihydrolipoamide succinyltransferase)
MILEIKIPSPGESITEVEIAHWLVADGDFVEKDQEVAEVESEKATLPLIAPEAGTITIRAQAGSTLKVGAVACTIDTAKVGKMKKPKQPQEPTSKAGKTTEKKTGEETGKVLTVEEKAEPTHVKTTPVARKQMEEHGLSVDDILHGLRRITSKEVEMVLQARNAGSTVSSILPGSRDAERQKMSQLRKKLSERLVAVKNQTAMLTTFNEVDMSEVMRIRQAYQKEFTEKHGVKLGFMSFFIRAAAEALRQFPNVNSMINGEEIVTHHYCDIGIAVQTEKGLMVPVLRNAESLSLAQMEKAVADLAAKARANRISMDEMAGGTFTITNGGIFGSMLSTPILNPPQAAILGMHNIVNRPVAVEGKVEIRPIMYVALSYDHRLIDGKDSVSFLVKIKEFIESPVRMLLGGQHPDRLLLGL